MNLALGRQLGEVVADTERPLGVWEFDHLRALAAVRPAIIDGLLSPTFQVDLLRSYGDVVIVRVADRTLPCRRMDAIYYVERRGSFVPLRREDWPAIHAGSGPRVILTLRASAG